MTGDRDDSSAGPPAADADETTADDARPADAPPKRGPRPGGRSDEPVLPSVSRDDTDIGWGDEPGARDEEWYRRERPPHHE